jgi:Tfp pilus assembly protein PilN
MVPNLAHQPFVNHRPVRRLALLAWVAAVALLASNSWLYWSAFASRGEQRSELEQLEARTADERAHLEAALVTLERFDLDWQRDQIAFLNARIAERTFSWSALFDDLAEVLPTSVRVERLTPEIGSRRGHGRGLRKPGDAVTLEIAGVAQRDDALLDLVDGFFAHERFSRPNLRVEARQQGGQVTFSMSVVYRPAERAAEAGEAEASEAPDEPPVDEAPAAAVAEPEVRS